MRPAQALLLSKRWLSDRMLRDVSGLGAQFSPEFLEHAEVIALEPASQPLGQRLRGKKRDLQACRRLGISAARQAKDVHLRGAIDVPQLRNADGSIHG